MKEKQFKYYRIDGHLKGGWEPAAGIYRVQMPRGSWEAYIELLGGWYKVHKPIRQYHEISEAEAMLEML